MNRQKDYLVNGRQLNYDAGVNDRGVTELDLGVEDDRGVRGQLDRVGRQVTPESGHYTNNLIGYH